MNKQNESEIKSVVIAGIEYDPQKAEELVTFRARDGEREWSAWTLYKTLSDRVFCVIEEWLLADKFRIEIHRFAIVSAMEEAIHQPGVRAVYEELFGKIKEA